MGANSKFWSWLFAFSGTFFLLGAWQHDKDGMFGQTSAAWVQAVGSVGAIIGLIFVSHRESFRASQQRDAEHTTYLISVGKVIHRCAQIPAVMAWACKKNGSVREWPMSGHAEILKVSETIDISRLCDPVLVDIYLSVKWNSSQIFDLVSRSRLDGEDEDPNMLERLETLGKSSAKHLDAVERLFPPGVTLDWREPEKGSE